MACAGVLVGLTALIAAPAPVLAAPARTVIFLNRGGGTYTPGYDDAATNHSSIVARPTVVPPWQHSDALWNAVVDCVGDQFSRWNVEVTDVDPGSAPHMEAVFGGQSSDLDFVDPIGGVSPNAQCGTIPKTIVFVFTAKLTAHPELWLCNAAAQELGHSLGLDHQMTCKDPMTYYSACLVQRFQDVDAPCGEFAARTCQCGGDTQNSVRHLDAVLGRAPDQGCSASPGAGLVPVAVALGFARLLRRRRRR